MPTEKASTTLPGKVERVIHAHPASGEPEKAQIAVEGADHLYREIRVPNDLTDAQGQKVKLKVGAEVGGQNQKLTRLPPMWRSTMCPERVIRALNCLRQVHSQAI